MAKVGAQRAAELTGRSKSTIQRAMNAGKLSFELDANERRVIDVSELERAFGFKPSASAAQDNAPSQQDMETQMEIDRLRLRIRFLEEQLENAMTQVEDIKNQRDQWQKQATQVLITSQYSQKQAEELKAQMEERERRVRERRQQRLDQQMKRLKPHNENEKFDLRGEDFFTQFNFRNLWQRMRKLA